MIGVVAMAHKSVLLMSQKNLFMVLLPPLPSPASGWALILCMPLVLENVLQDRKIVRRFTLRKFDRRTRVKNASQEI